MSIVYPYLKHAADLITDHATDRSAHDRAAQTEQTTHETATLGCASIVPCHISCILRLTCAHVVRTSRRTGTHERPELRVIQGLHLHHLLQVIERLLLVVLS